MYPIVCMTVNEVFVTTFLYLLTGTLYCQWVFFEACIHLQIRGDLVFIFNYTHVNLKPRNTTKLTFILITTMKIVI